MNRIQITEDLFVMLVKYHLCDLRDPEQENAIKTALKDKLDALVKHNLYTTFKTAKTPQEREAARQKYLEGIGLHKDWRW